MKGFRFLGLSLLSIAISCVCACTSLQDKRTTPQKQIVLASLIDYLWTSQPNAMNNDMTRNVFADSLKAAIKINTNDTLPILSDITMKYSSCELYKRMFESFDSEIDKNAGRYLVTFLFEKQNITKDISTHFEVVTILDADKVSSLVEDSTYHVQGTFIDFANNSKETGLIYPNGKCRINYPRLEKDGFGKPSISLGTIVIDNATIKQ